MWPTALWFDREFIKLTGPSQRLFVFLWTHPDLNPAGFVPLQIDVWSRLAYDMAPEDVDAWLDELLARQWVDVDDETGELWIRSFMERDTSRKPYIWVAATRAVATCRSDRLRAEAWTEIQRLGAPVVSRDPNADAKKTARYDKMQRDIDAAFEGLEQVEIGDGPPSSSSSIPSSSSSVGLRTVSRPSPDRPETVCSRCGKYPAMERGLCGACLGREMAG
jgi:hypothetical protein